MTQRIPFISLMLAICVLLPALAACGGSDPAPVSTPDADSADAEQVTIGMVPVLIYGPVLLAHEKGYFQDQGIDSELVSLAGGADMVTLTASGEFDIGIGGAGPAFFNAIERGIDLKIIAPLHFERPPQATPLMVSKERFENGELTSVTDLEGKKVAVNARGATEYWLDQALRTEGLTIEDIDLQELPFSDVPAALESGSLDASMLSEPLATQAERNGIAVRLADDFIADFQPTFVYVNPDFAAEHPDLVTSFLVAYLNGCRDLSRDDWDTEENLKLLERQTGVDQDLIKDSARTYCEPNGEIQVDDLATLQDFFGERGLLEYDDSLDVESIIDRTYLEQALDEIGQFEE